MKRRGKYSLIIAAVLIIILGVGFGVWKIFFAPKPLKERDMRITIPRASKPNGWTIYGIDIGSNTIFGWVSDNESIFHDKQVPLSSRGIRLAFVGVSEPMAVQAGDTLEIRLDGGQTLTIHLPALTEDVWLYIAPDGSTYYDEGLTKLAQGAATFKERRP